jgi:uncharacterized protein YegL
MDKIPAEPEIKLTAGFDRDLIWKEGASVRYVVADLIAHHGEVAINAPPPLNLALAIDVSGSMEGEKLAAAKKTAEEVTEALGPQDRLTIVAFSAKAQLLLSAATMDSAGKRKAQTAVRQLKSSGDTNLSDGWLLAAEQLAVAMQLNTETSHRLVLLSDGHANRGITDAAELAVHAGELLRRGIITSTVGIGDGYDEALLGGMAEAVGCTMPSTPRKFPRLFLANSRKDERPRWNGCNYASLCLQTPALRLSAHGQRPLFLVKSRCWSARLCTSDRGVSSSEFIVRAGIQATFCYSGCPLAGFCPMDHVRLKRPVSRRN